MILIGTSLAKAQEWAKLVQGAIGEEVSVASTLRAGATQLQTQEYSAVIIDQLLLDAEPDDFDAVLKNLGSAVPVYLNFAISSGDRIIRELRSALQRRKRETMVAREAARRVFRSELNDTLTAMLLSCEMALTVENLPSDAACRIGNVRELAREMSTKLALP